MIEQQNDILELARKWFDEGRKVALATVVSTWGSSPRPCGSQLVVDDKTEFFGSVSGGCVEGAVISEAQEVIHNMKPKLLEFSVSNEMAWDVGLACGGTVKIYVEPVVSEA
ncbi:MAG: XdhC family protein [Proteobacteria bacterium]|nr:XdhC family protein [Pseudomonadota bacterium]NOG59539.1 XdhC family protein [Pseudomonadota bacterium]